MKMYVIFSNEAIKAMGGNRGKLASMAGHAFLHSYVDSITQKKFSKDASKYLNGSAKKVTLVVETTKELQALYEQHKNHCGSTLVVDSGLTVFGGPTVVCAGFGPVEEDDEFLKDLKVLI